MPLLTELVVLCLLLFTEAQPGPQKKVLNLEIIFKIE